MMWADKLRERTLGSTFKVEELAGLLGVPTDESLKIFNALIRDCWVVPKRDRWRVINDKDRDEYIKQSIALCEQDIREKYELLTHYKRL